MGRMDGGGLDGNSSTLGETEGVDPDFKTRPGRYCLCQCIGCFWAEQCAHEWANRDRIIIQLDPLRSLCFLGSQVCLD